MSAETSRTEVGTNPLGAVIVITKQDSLGNVSYIVRNGSYTILETTVSADATSLAAELAV